MKITNNIIPIWQPQGNSTNYIAKKIGDLYGVKATHTGTLDPMAEGVVIILLKDARLKRHDLTSSLKGYEFEIAFGIKTDSFDGMGFIQEETQKEIEKEDVEKILTSFIGSYTQTVPIFSAQLYKGKKLFEWGHLKESIPLPKKSGEIYKLDLLDTRYVSLDIFKEEILNKLNNIQGNFRQEDIIKQWKSYDPTLTKIQICRFYVEVSRGLYVRSLSQDICEKLNTIGFVYSLIRIKNGNYDLNNSLKLDTFFGKNYVTILKS